METFSSLEQLAHRLQEQIHGLRERTIPELEEKISNLGGSANVEELTNQINDLKNNVIPSLDEKFATIEQMQSTESNLTNLINELDGELTTVKAQVNDITQNVIPALEQRITSGGGSSSSGSDWITVYDMKSEDETLNWGYPNGILGNQGVISTSVDFMPYSYMRIYYVATNVTYTMHEFHIREANDSDLDSPSFTFSFINLSLNSLVSLIMMLTLQEDGRRLFNTGIARLHNFRTNAYISQTGVSTNTGYYIYRIDVK